MMKVKIPIRDGQSLHCPECGKLVFRPIFADGIHAPTGYLICSDMGHWTGDDYLTLEQWQSKQEIEPAPEASEYAWW